MRGVARLRRRLGREQIQPPVDLGPERRSEATRLSGVVLTEPADDAKGVFLVNGTHLRFFVPIAGDLRRDYVTVLTHWWAMSKVRLREYRRHAPLFDCVVSPSAGYDTLFDFAPTFRAHTADLVVDDELWPLLDLPRDIDVVESVSIPWATKRPLAWLDGARRLLDTRPDGRAVYMAKREPGAKESERDRLEWRQFRTLAEADGRITVLVGATQEDVAGLYNRARFLYHPSDREFGPRCVLEALYCGAVVLVDDYPWRETATTREELRRRVVVAEGLREVPAHDVVDVREWQTARGVRTALVELLAESHRVNRDVAAFAMFSNVRVGG